MLAEVLHEKYVLCKFYISKFYIRSKNEVKITIVLLASVSVVLLKFSFFL